MLAAFSDRLWRRQATRLPSKSAFYAAKLKGLRTALAGGLTLIGELPMTTKEELRSAQEAEPPFGPQLAVPEAEVKRVFQTSGTTGRPGLVALTAADLKAWTRVGSRAYHATGIHPHHRVLVPFGAGPFVAGHAHLTLDALGAGTVPVTPGDSERTLNAFRLGLVDTFLCTPSFALHLSNLCERRDLDARRFGIRHVVPGGEPGGGIPAIRDRIAERFGAAVTEVMGIGDVCPSLFAECPAQAGMHFCGQGYVWPELVEPGGGRPLPIQAGAVGELVYTTLARQAMPVVRFRSGDVVEVLGTSCACGRTSFRIRVRGRTDDMFIVRGVNVHPSAILGLLGDFRPRVTGRARVLLPDGEVAVEPPVPVEVEIPAGSDPADSNLAGEIEAAIRARLTFRARVALIPEPGFGPAGYKTRLAVRRS